MAVAVAPDGYWLATAGQDGAVRIWEAATGAVRAVMRVDGALTACQWSPCRLSVAAAGQQGLYLFNFKP
jgi:WD40 repeat protein